MEWATFQGTQKIESSVMTARDFPDSLGAAFWWSYPNTSSFLFNAPALVDAGGWDENVKNCTDYALYFNCFVLALDFAQRPRRGRFTGTGRTQATNEDRPEMRTR